MSTSKRRESPWSEEIAPDGTVTTSMRVRKLILWYGTRVRYVGPPRDGIPDGRMGTLMNDSVDGISMVQWDPCENSRVPMSEAPINDLEVVTSQPRCLRPTRPGMYLLRRGVQIEVATLREEPRGLFLVSGIGAFPLEDLEEEVTWWGPIEAR